jgi:peptide/nickel transport system substrate-binding protein
VTIALVFEPDVLEPSLLAVSREIAPVTSAFLTYVTPRQEARPYLAAELPSVENGSWKVFPDGRMETTYKLRPDAKWQDGQPVTAHDFIFAYQTRLDPAFPAQRLGIERRLQTLTALDDHTLFLEWKEPYGAAGRVPAPDFAPMHRQYLEPISLEDRASFIDGAHWRDRYIGSGPYRIERWEPGVQLTFRAHEGFVLGKPPIDEVVIKVIPDPNTVLANLLGNTVDVAFSQTVGFPQGQALEQSGWDGAVQYRPRSPRMLDFQTREWPNVQRAVFDQRVRQAALYAVDRASIVDNIYAGKAQVAYFWMPPSDPSFAEADRVVRKYAYDPSRSAALLQEAGWVRSPDGLARNAAGEPLEITIQNQPNDVDQQEALVIADNWKGVGITSEVQRLTTQAIRDGELRSKFAGVDYGRRALTLDDMVWTSQQITRPENRWSGQNYSGYSNPVVEQSWKAALGSVDPNERHRLLIQALQVMMDDASMTLTHIQPGVMAFPASLRGPELPDAAVAAGAMWNLWQWERL